MKTITLTLGEIFDLGTEISGNGNGTMGMMREKLPVHVKYWVNDLKKTIGDDVKAIGEFQGEMLSKYGERAGETGRFHFPDPEKLKAYNTEMGVLLSQEKEISYRPLKLSMFNELITDQPYSILFRFVDNDLPAEEPG